MRFAKYMNSLTMNFMREFLRGAPISVVSNGEDWYITKEAIELMLIGVDTDYDNYVSSVDIVSKFNIKTEDTEVVVYVDSEMVDGYDNILYSVHSKIVMQRFVIYDGPRAGLERILSKIFSSEKWAVKMISRYKRMGVENLYSTNSDYPVYQLYTAIRQTIEVQRKHLQDIFDKEISPVLQEQLP